MDRDGAAGEGGGGANRLDPRARDRLRLPLSRRALRELDDTGRRLAVGCRRSVRGDGSPEAIRPRQQHLRPDRHCRADRARRQERHPDHRVCDRAAATRPGDCRRCDRSRPTSLPRGNDDVVRFHRRTGAARYRHRRRCRDDTRGRDSSFWRNGRRELSRDFRDPRPHVLLQTLRERIKSLSKPATPAVPQGTLPQKAAE